MDSGPAPSARPGMTRVMVRRTSTDAQGRKSRRLPRRRPGARRRLARDRRRRHRRHRRRQRRRQDLAHPRHRRHAQAGARAHPLPRRRHRRLAEPQGLRTGHRPGGRGPAGIPLAVGRREPEHGRHAGARARRPRAQPGARLCAVSGAGRAQRASRRHPVGRRAADARHRAMFNGCAGARDVRRAFARIGANDRAERAQNHSAT